jgi:hypothetical protein
VLQALEALLAALQVRLRLLDLGGQRLLLGLQLHALTLRHLHVLPRELQDLLQTALQVLLLARVLAVVGQRVQEADGLAAQVSHLQLRLQ